VRGAGAGTEAGLSLVILYKWVAAYSIVTIPLYDEWIGHGSDHEVQNRVPAHFEICVSTASVMSRTGTEYKLKFKISGNMT
jgi:hypothetical protein